MEKVQLLPVQTMVHFNLKVTNSSW